MERKKVRAYAAAGTALVLAALFSFGLPAFLFRWQDEKLEGQIGQEETAQVVLTEQPELTIVEKVRLMGRESSYSMPLEKGKNYDSVTIIERVEQELAQLEELGVLNGAEGKVEEAYLSASFMMDVEGDNSLIFWMGQVFTESGMSVELTVDDETGKILNLCCEGMIQKGNEAETLVYSWAEYLGCHVASVRVTEIGGESALNEKERKNFENEVQEQTDDGMPKEEARARVREAWGLSESGFLAEVFYGDDSGWEMVYQFRVDPFQEESLTILSQ